MNGTVSNFLLMTGQLQPRIKVYVDAWNSLTYLCDAVKGSALTDSVWHVTKCHLAADGSIEETRTNPWYVSPATSLAVVELLTFS
jgi:hypothetical protein